MQTVCTTAVMAAPSKLGDRLVYKLNRKYRKQMKSFCFVLFVYLKFAVTFVSFCPEQMYLCFSQISGNFQHEIFLLSATVQTWPTIKLILGHTVNHCCSYL